MTTSRKMDELAETQLAELAAMSEAEARAVIDAVHTPELDAFRERVPRAKTSGLVMLLIHPKDLMEVVAPDVDDLSKPMPDDMNMRCAAAVMAIMDELDRRIPVPLTSVKKLDQEPTDG